MELTTTFDVRRMTRLGRVKAIAPAPSGEWAAVAVARLNEEETRYVSDLWRVSLATEGAAPEKLTRGDSDDDTPRFRRDGALGFRSDRAREGEDRQGEEAGRHQVWLLPMTGGEPYPLTEEPLGVEDFRFAAEADCLVLRSNRIPGVPDEEQRKVYAARTEGGPTGRFYTRMPARFWDHWLGPAAPHFVAFSGRGSGRRDLTPFADREYRPVLMPDYAWDISPDGRFVVAPAVRPGPDRMDDTSLHVIGVATGEVTPLGGEEGTRYGAPIVSHDGKRIACWRQAREARGPGRKQLWLFSGADDRKGRAIAPAWDAWPTPQAFAPSGDAVVATADVEGSVPVHRVEVPSGEVIRVTSEAAGGCHDQIHVVGDQVMGLRHRLLHPPEPFCAPLQAEATPRLLASLSGFSAEEGARIARWESFVVSGDGGDPVQSFLVRPAEGSPEPRPALLWIHGGPVAHNADGWQWRWNPLIPAAAGYAVALPNPRGSTGFGQGFIEGIWNNAWGGACYRDVLAVADALQEREDIDAERIAPMGGSFGGYMVNWIAASTDRFRCLVSHAGVYHLSAFHGATDAPSFWEHHLGGTPDRDLESFERYSPHRGLARWRTPTLIIHGERDYRVPLSQALLQFEDLTRQGIDTELLVFPDENHWILKPQNIRQWYQHIFDFLARHMSP